MIEPICCELADPSTFRFGKVLSIGWFQGTVSGLAHCDLCGAEFKYDLVAWNSNCGTRIFTLIPVARGEYDRISEMVRSSADPFLPVWSELNRRLTQSATRDHVLASDWELKTIFAARRLDDAARTHLPVLFFDDRPASPDFAFWKSYLALPE